MRARFIIQFDNIKHIGLKNGKFSTPGIHGLVGGFSSTRYWSGATRVYRCSETVQATYRRFEIPEWMFERAACCGVARAESPRVSRAALNGLKAVILGAFGATAGEMTEAGAPKNRDFRRRARVATC